jgi:hypothetical protein
LRSWRAQVKERATRGCAGWIMREVIINEGVTRHAQHNHGPSNDIVMPAVQVQHVFSGHGDYAVTDIMVNEHITRYDNHGPVHGMMVVPIQVAGVQMRKCCHCSVIRSY